MSTFRNPSPERLEFRIPAEQKALIERAAAAQGQTVSGFALRTLLGAAQEVVQAETERSLSARDSRLFLELLSSPPKPNAALKAAASRYKTARDGAARDRARRGN
ncbi:MAG: DUF1778 domain-containing protein [Phycisphaerae bacterium]|nr:DUF1778 domain-containing protein [Phycisphaerae bacterium]